MILDTIGMAAEQCQSDALVEEKTKVLSKSEKSVPGNFICLAISFYEIGDTILDEYVVRLTQIFV